MGRDVLLRQKKEGVTQRMASFLLDDDQPLLYHNEPIWRDNEIVGYITSGMFGYTLGRSIGMGYVTNPDGVNAAYVKSGTYEIEVAGERIPAQVSLKPWYDPKGENIKK